MGIGPSEILLVLLIAVVLFGAKKIPELARGVGQGIREFKKAASEVNEPEKQENQKPQITSSEKND